MKTKLLHALFALTFICQAFYSNAQTGNTKLGTYALLNNTTGDYNTALGFFSLYLNTSGTFNTASGYLTLSSNTSGYFNTASGASSLHNNTTGYYNTASGARSLLDNTSGNYNTASGYWSLSSNTTGRYNTAIGAASLRYNTTAYFNAASGAYSLYSNTTGYSNTGSGYSSLYSNTTGSANTASGISSLRNNTTGRENTAYGSYAMYSNTTGSYNTAVGDSAGNKFNFNNSTFIGYKTNVTVTGLTNVTVIGNKTSATASNQVRIGNSAVTSIGGKVGWTTLSDGRFKKNIKADVPGLAFISKLRPVTYTVDIDALDNATGVIEAPSTEQITARIAAAQEKHTGFIAQEVEKVANELKYDFGGVDKPKNDKDLYGLRYSEFVVPLVMAVQELSRMNDEKNAKINELETRLLKLETLINAQQSSSLITKQSILQLPPR